MSQLGEVWEFSTDGVANKGLSASNEKCKRFLNHAKAFVVHSELTALANLSRVGETDYDIPRSA